MRKKEEFHGQPRGTFEIRALRAQRYRVPVWHRLDNRYRGSRCTHTSLRCRPSRLARAMTLAERALRACHVQK